MKKPEIPINESDRQAALECYSILDTLPEQEYDDLTQLAASICGTPIALISLIDRDRQWFKSRVGIDASETPRNISFCGHVVASNKMLLVTDTLQDERFADNPLVVNYPNIRFYAGLPLRTSDNFSLGTLCVIDRQPRDLTPLQIQQLESLSRLVMSLLELRRNNEAANLLVSVQESSNKVSILQQAILDSVNLAVISTDLQGKIQSFNSGAEGMLGYASSEAIGKNPAIFHDINEIIESSHQLSAELNQTIEAGFEVFIAKAKLGHIFEREWTYICKNGDRIPVLLSITPIHNQQKEITGFLGVAKDITSQKEAECDRKELQEQLTDSAAKLNDILNSVRSVVTRLLVAEDGSWEIDYISKGCKAISGYSAQELTTDKELWVSRIDPEHWQAIEPVAYADIFAGREGTYTYRLQHRDRTWRWISQKNTSRWDINLNAWVVTIISADITDRKRIETDLRTSEEHFRHAFEDASIGMAIISLDGHWFKVNTALCNTLGYSSEELLTLAFQDITHPDDLEADFSYAHQLLKGEISTYQMEKRYFHKQGHIVWILLNKSLVQDDRGNPLHFIAQIQDITAQKDAQKTLQLQSIIMNNMAGGVCLVRASGLIIVFTNPKFDAMFGYGEGELIGQPVSILNYVDTQVTPDATVLDIVSQLDLYGEAKYEVHNKKKDGTLFWCRVHTSRFEHSEYGTVYVAVQQDVTELKLTEQALQATKNRLDFLLNYNPAVIFSSKTDGDFGATFVSENIKDVLGYEPKAFLEESGFWLNHLHPDDVDQVLNGLTNLFVDGFYTQEFRFLHVDGSYRWIFEQLKLIKDRLGEPVEILGYLIDISVRKRIETDLQRSKAALLEAQAIAHIGSWEFDIQSQKITWSPELFRMFGLDPSQPEPSYTDYLQLIHPNDSMRLHQCVEQAINHGIPYQIDYRPFLTDGSIHYHEGKAEIEWDEKGQIKRLFGTTLDITDRINAQKALEEMNRDLESRVEQRTAALRSSKEALQMSERRFRSFFNYAPIGIGVADIQTYQFVGVNLAFCQILGVSETELLDSTIMSISLSDDWQLQKSHIKSLLSNEIDFYQIEKRYIRKNGEILTGNLTGTVIKDDAGNFTHLICMVEDITQRKKSEDALKASRQFLQTVLDSFPLAVFWKNCESVILGCNQLFAQISGLGSPLEAIGKTNFDFSYTEAQALKYLEDDRQVMDSGIAKLNIEETITLPTGEQRWIQTNKIPLYDTKGEVVGMVGTFQDITERVEITAQKEKLYLRLTNELNQRETLLKEIHHRVKNNLQIMSSLLRMQFRRTSPEVRAIAEEYQNRIQSMALIHDQLYRSENLSHIDFHNYLQNLAAHLFFCYSINSELIKLNIEVNDISLPLDLSIPLGLIINELLSNTLKYAFPEGQGAIDIKLEPIGKNLNLVVADDGIGLPPGLDYENTDSLGMQLVLSLTDQLGGKVTYAGEEGTAFQITFPMPEFV